MIPHWSNYSVSGFILTRSEIHLNSPNHQKIQKKGFFKTIYICTEAWKEIMMTNKELYNILFSLYYTLFLYKNLVYKNVEAQIKNIIVNLSVAISTSYSASYKI